MKNKRALGALFILAALCLVLVFVFFVIQNVSIETVRTVAPNCDGKTALEIAYDIGRLDLISMALAFLGIAVAFFAIFSFFAIREDAESAAEDKAEAVATREIKSQLEELLPTKIEEYMKKKKGPTSTSISGSPDISDVTEVGDK